MTGKEKLIAFTTENFPRKLTKINDHIYHFLGYGHSNAIAVIAEHSVILIDTLDSDVNAQDMRKELEAITDKPVKTIIFTHGHPDHRGGSGAYRDTVEEIIAYAPAKQTLQYYDHLSDILKKRSAFQFGYALTQDEVISQGIGIREGHAIGRGHYDFLAPTMIYKNEMVERVIDGVRLKLVPAVGESDDQIFIWLPDDQVMCCGDNYYGCWPNLYAIRGTQYRDIAAWVDSLDEILSYDAVALLPGHTRPLLSKDEIQQQVGTFRDAIRYVLTETLACMNQGMTMSECVEHVKLPKQFDQDYLGEFYGTVEWSVKSIYSGYVGWFDGQPSHLMPVSDHEYRAALLELMDPNALMEKIKACMEDEQYQMALQLLELIAEKKITDETASAEIKALTRECLLKRADQVTSANARHYFIASAHAME